jgi:hypothetical protein
MTWQLDSNHTFKKEEVALQNAGFILNMEDLHEKEIYFFLSVSGSGTTPSYYFDCEILQ